MKKICDICKKHVKEVGKLFKVGYLYLCKTCRRKFKYSVVRKKTRRLRK